MDVGEEHDEKPLVWGNGAYHPCAKQKSQIKMEEDDRKDRFIFRRTNPLGGPLPSRGGGGGWKLR